MVADEGSNDVDGVLDGADRVVGVREVHLRDLNQCSKQIIISPAVLQVHAHLLEETTSQVDGSGLGRNGTGVKWDFILHLHLLLLEDASLKAVDLRAPLVPLEGMKSLWELRSETTLDVVVNSEVSFNEVVKVVNNLICVLVEKSLQLAHLLVVVEVLLVLGVKLFEDELVVLEGLNQLVLTSLLG